RSSPPGPCPVPRTGRSSCHSTAVSNSCRRRGTAAQVDPSKCRTVPLSPITYTSYGAEPHTSDRKTLVPRLAIDEGLVAQILQVSVIDGPTDHRQVLARCQLRCGEDVCPEA